MNGPDEAPRRNLVGVVLAAAVTGASVATAINIINAARHEFANSLAGWGFVLLGLQSWGLAYVGVLLIAWGQRQTRGRGAVRIGAVAFALLTGAWAGYHLQDLLAADPQAGPVHVAILLQYVLGAGTACLLGLVAALWPQGRPAASAGL